MTRKFRALDRIACLLLGLALIAAALLVIDWKYEVVVDSYPDTPRLQTLTEWTATEWWPWAVGGAGLLLTLLGIWWLVSHLPRPGHAVMRLRDSDPTGRLEVDLTSVADALGRQYEETSPVNDVSTATESSGRDELLVVRAYVDPRADGVSLSEAARSLAEEVQAAFPDGQVQARVLIHAPRTPSRFRRSQRTARVL